MSKQSSVNNGSITGAQAMYILKTVLKSAGWTVPRSSDGITYNSTGDQITHGGSGAGGMQNDRAWFVIESPNGEHQWCFQKEITDNAEWRVKMSALDGFVGGSPNATTVPSATDEVFMHGSGTDASPTMADLFPVDGTYRFHVIAEDVAVGSAVPIYPFWAFVTDTGLPVTLIMQEAMDPDSFPELSSGTRAAPVVGDPDPCIYACTFNTTGYAFDIRTGWNALTYVQGWYKYNYGDSQFVGFDGYWMAGESANYTGSPHDDSYGFGQNPYNGSDEGHPLAIGRDATLGTYVGWKGFCQHIRARTVDREYPNTINLATDARVYARNLLIPWENGTAPLV